MRLLICTQTVDLDDPVLGFFHRWIEEFSTRVEHIHVICLKEGRHTLPSNVNVHSLGKESGRSLFKYVSRVYRFVWSLRREYDAVFVHMNEEYMLLGGPLWRLWGKRAVLWRNHKMGSWRTSLAVSFTDDVCHTSPDAYVASGPKAHIMPLGIDTETFHPPAELPAPGSILFLGRLDPVKKIDVFLEVMRQLTATHPSARVDVYGDPTGGKETYAETIKARFSDLTNVKFHGAVTHDKTPDVYRSHAIYVNLTPSGSFDKTIGEAMASGCIVVAGNSGIRPVLDPRLFVNDVSNIDSASRSLAAAIELTSLERREEAERLVKEVRDSHSLALLVPRLLRVLT